MSGLGYRQHTANLLNSGAGWVISCIRRFRDKWERLSFFVSLLWGRMRDMMYVLSCANFTSGNIFTVLFRYFLSSL